MEFIVDHRGKPRQSVSYDLITLFDDNVSIVLEINKRYYKAEIR